ncbi:hypothetical protein HZA97_02910 [Candidatus Woesearchaeota archaeon]|nr:hypothetical protein [Candidatus Woesearchaeota archaeon]
MVKKTFFLFFLFILLASSVYADNTVLIYKNEACGHCTKYLAKFKEYLANDSFKITEKNIINDISARKELDLLNQKHNIPFELQGHMAIVLNKDLILEGHVPLKIIDDLFKKYPDKNFPRIVIYQDSMSDDVDSYKVLEENKEVKECSVDTKITDCSNSTPKPKKWWESSLFLIVLTTGLLAGIHPCTISVLLFFIAFLFTIRKSRVGIFKIGALYILGVFVAYLFIGLGILKAITFAEPHFAAKIAAYLVIILGLINLKEYFLPRKWISLGIPHTSKETITNLIEKASAPAAFFLGIFVGICSFGCTAGIYISILGLLISEVSKGFFYLVLYNVMFIVPLIIMLFLASNKKVVKKIEELEQSKKDLVKLIAGLIMILLGLFILFGVVMA